jgi:flagellar biosynthesis protein FlhA
LFDPAEPQPSEQSDGRGPPSIEILFGRDISDSWKSLKSVLTERIAALRVQQEKATGFAFPAVTFHDGAQLAPNEYQIHLFGARHGQSKLYPDRTLAIRATLSGEPLPGIEARDPAFGLPGVWVAADDREAALDRGFTLVDPVTVLMTHIGEVVRAQASLLLTRGDVVPMLEGVRARQPGLVEELVPGVMTVADIQRVLQSLLAEEVSIRNIDLIAEALVDVGRHTRDPAELTELVRQRLSHGICHGLRGTREQLSVLSLNPRVEAQISDSVRRSDGGGGFVIEPRLAEQLIRKLLPMSESMMQESLSPVLLCGPDIRRHLKAFTRRSIPRLAIISVSEVPSTIDLKSFAVVNVE